MEIVMTAQGCDTRQLQTTMTTVVVLAPHEVLRVPAAWDRIFVVSGTAWLTDSRGDRLVWPGESVAIESPDRVRLPAVVGGTTERPLIIEFTGPSAADVLPAARPKSSLFRLLRRVTAGRRGLSA